MRKRLRTTDTVVLNLFGQAASTPQYAIHEEDRLEWLHALLSDTASLPDWLAYQLKHQPMLFVGCEIPDWIGRFLLRMSSNTRLSLERKQFFFVGSSTSYEPSLSDFFATYCRKAQVQQLEMEPTAFVAELRARWEEQSAARPPAPVGAPGPSAPDAPTIFISYMREDADAARRLCDAISELGGDVWLDERRLRPGDAWEPEILTAIRQTVRLFVPIISANTEREEEGYVFREWREAVRSIALHSESPLHRAGDCRRRLRRVTRVGTGRFQMTSGACTLVARPAGEPDAELLAMLTDEIRAMRRTDAA